MPKNKVHKGLLKRTRISKTGKLRHRTAFHSHLSSHKSGKRLRPLRAARYAPNSEATRHEKMLFRRLRGRDAPRTAIRRSPSPAERAAAKQAASEAANAES